MKIDIDSLKLLGIYDDKIYYEDVDIGGFAYHSKYLNYCERGRSTLFFSKKRLPLEDGYHFVVKEMSAEFLNPGRFGDIISVETYMKGLKSASLELVQIVKKKDEEGTALFRMTILLVCLQGVKISKIPMFFREIFEN